MFNLSLKWKLLRALEIFAFKGKTNDVVGMCAVCVCVHVGVDQRSDEHGMTIGGETTKDNDNSTLEKSTMVKTGEAFHDKYASCQKKMNPRFSM